MSSDRDKLKGGPAFWCHICNAGLEGCGHPPDERSGSATVAQVSDRDKLIAEARATYTGKLSDIKAWPLDAVVLIGKLADALEVAELVRDTPRVVSTVAELDALPIWTVFRTHRGIVWEVVDEGTDGLEVRYSSTAIKDRYQSKTFEGDLPATVLFTPTSKENE